MVQENQPLQAKVSEGFSIWVLFGTGYGADCKSVYEGSSPLRSPPKITVDIRVDLV